MSERPPVQETASEVHQPTLGLQHAEPPQPRLPTNLENLHLHWHPIRYPLAPLFLQLVQVLHGSTQMKPLALLLRTRTVQPPFLNIVDWLCIICTIYVTCPKFCDKKQFLLWVFLSFDRVVDVWLPVLILPGPWAGITIELWYNYICGKLDGCCWNGEQRRR